MRVFGNPVCDFEKCCDIITPKRSVTSILDSEEKAITNVEEGMVIVDDNDDNDEPKRAEKSQCEEEDRSMYRRNLHLN